ncbi:tetratricopeptide repeat protein [Alphaproteobacteria bacterium]|nr:tetratricopeptide repeat protein [Alphaproteobacteria bacterium]
MAKLSVDQALSKAKSYEKKGDIKEAQKLYEIVLEAFPKNNRAQKSLDALRKLNPSTATKSPPHETVNQLVNLYNQGQLQKVAEQAKALIELYPEEFDIWNILGVACVQTGKLDDAIVAFQQIIALNPNYADAYNNMGNALQEKGKLGEAIASYKKALSLKPNNAHTCYNIGTTLQKQGKLGEAITSYKKALLLKPDYEDACISIGNAFQEQGKLEEAIVSYKKVLSLKPDNATALNNMGMALQKQGQLGEAITAYNKALLHKPDYAHAHNHKGNALQELGDLKEAVAAYNQALSLKPDYANAWYNKGNTLHKQGKPDEAIVSYKKALSFKPDHADGFNNMGAALLRKGELVEAIASYSRALAIKPDYEAVRAQKLHQQAHICDWPGIEVDEARLAEIGTARQSVLPFTLLSFEDAPQRHRIRSKLYAQEKVPYNILPLNTRHFLKPKKIRIGYFSTDFREHPVAYLIAKVFQLHNRDKFEIFGYSLYGNEKSAVRRRVAKSFDCFINVQDMSDKDVALRARQDKIDIAIDLTGYTENGRIGIFAHRAAPIQINFLGYPGTLGADFIDYIIADPIVIPSTQRSAYSEKIIYLPHTYQPNDNTRVTSQKVSTRAEMGLPESSFVFCCFNNNYKISPVEFDIWMRLISKVEGSVLWLLKSNRWAEQNLLQEAEKRGIKKDRLVFAEKLPPHEHLARHKHADLFIDTFNYNAHTTASDALWVGLPIVTKMGQGFATRVAGSLLNAIGLPELITKNEQDYESLILELATNPDRLSKVKEKLKANCFTHPLFDTEQYTKYLEDGYQQTYQNYCEGHQPRTIIVLK